MLILSMIVVVVVVMVVVATATAIRKRRLSQFRILYMEIRTVSSHLLDLHTYKRSAHTYVAIL